MQPIVVMKKRKQAMVKKLPQLPLLILLRLLKKLKKKLKRKLLLRQRLKQRLK